MTLSHLAQSKYVNYKFALYLESLKIQIMGRSRSRSPVADRRDGGGNRDGPKKYHSSDLHSVRIGNDLPADVSLEEIREVFEKFGEIGDVFLPKDRDTGDTRGFGFVRFVNKEDQDYA